LGKPRKFWVRLSGVLAEIQTQHLPNTSLQCYRCVNMVGVLCEGLQQWFRLRGLITFKRYGICYNVILSFRLGGLNTFWRKEKLSWEYFKVLSLRLRRMTYENHENIHFSWCRCRVSNGASLEYKAEDFPLEPTCCIHDHINFSW
jgi:hypothetical protein